MINTMNEITRHKELVVEKIKTTQSRDIIDPDKFPIQRLTYDIINIYNMCV